MSWRRALPKSGLRRSELSWQAERAGARQRTVTNAARPVLVEIIARSSIENMAIRSIQSALARIGRHQSTVFGLEVCCLAAQVSEQEQLKIRWRNETVDRRSRRSTLGRNQMRRHHDHQLGLVLLIGGGAEQGSYNRQVAQEGILADIALIVIRQQARHGERFAVTQLDRCMGTTNLDAGNSY